MKKIYLLVISILVLSCESQKEITIDENNLLLGTWSHSSFENNKTSFIRVKQLPEENYGIIFEKTNNFTERTSGFCGTPPLSYFNVSGFYKIENDVIIITTQSFPNIYSWKILELNETILVIERVLSEQEKDHEELMKLFDEISNLAYSNSCTNENDWTFTQFGTKACGGPQGYIPYSKTIDTLSFLEKVNTYSEAEKNYNIKWGIASTCDIPKIPKKVECNNGYPVLIYQ